MITPFKKIKPMRMRNKVTFPISQNLISGSKVGNSGQKHKPSVTRSAILLLTT